MDAIVRLRRPSTSSRVVGGSIFHFCLLTVNSTAPPKMQLLVELLFVWLLVSSPLTGRSGPVAPAPCCFVNNPPLSLLIQFRLYLPSTTNA